MFSEADNEWSRLWNHLCGRPFRLDGRLQHHCVPEIALGKTKRRRSRLLGDASEFKNDESFFSAEVDACPSGRPRCRHLPHHFQIELRLGLGDQRAAGQISSGAFMASGSSLSKRTGRVAGS
jgi:hypothetical protein